jgi:putative molybdopterin biosynthesis protein
MNADDDFPLSTGPAPSPEAEGDNLNGTGLEPNGMRLRLARQGRGFSQQQLARMAGVSRQAVSAVESGLSDPSLRVALALSRALGMTVEEVFGQVTPEPRIDARPLGVIGGGGARVSLAQVGDSFVAVPLSGAAATSSGFVPAAGLADESDGQRNRPTRAVRPLGPPRPTLIVAGCDPAFPLLEVPLGLLDPPLALLWWQCPSHDALELAATGLVHAAGSHLRDQSGDYNVEPTRKLFPQGADIIGFSSWREGLVLRPDIAGNVSDLADVAKAGLRLVNRQSGSEARLVLDRELARLGIDAGQLRGYDTKATGHLQVASAIAAGLADAGIANEPAALAYGLAFIPLAKERFDIIIPPAHAATREVQGLLRALRSRWLRDQLASLPGYDPTGCGEPFGSIEATRERTVGEPRRERRRARPSRR